MLVATVIRDEEVMAAVIGAGGDVAGTIADSTSAGGADDFGDEVGHCDFDVQLDKVD